MLKKISYIFIFLIWIIFLIYGLLNVYNKPKSIEKIKISIKSDTKKEDDIIKINFKNIDNLFKTKDDIYIWLWALDYNWNVITNKDINWTWEKSLDKNKLVKDKDWVYNFWFIPSIYFNKNWISKIWFLIKNIDWTIVTKDYYIDLNWIKYNKLSPINEDNVIDNNDEIKINIDNLWINTDYELISDWKTIYKYTWSNFLYTQKLNKSKSYILKMSQNWIKIDKVFNYIVKNKTIYKELPNNYENWINYIKNDTSKVVLVLDAPFKDYVYVNWDFTNWNLDEKYNMYKDTKSTKFWIEINNLEQNIDYWFQYFVVQNNKIVRVADPFSTLILNKYDDINLKDQSFFKKYPQNQNYSIWILKTWENKYNWKIKNFIKPNKNNLVIYELSIWDFIKEQSYSGLINKIDYLKKLNINAIELLPVMEYDWNYDWWYRPNFFMALDKSYWSKNDLKNFIDLCHQNNIAVIFDIALNQSWWENSIQRMWNTSSDWWYWKVRKDNPYFNVIPKHVFSEVWFDLNHSSSYTKYLSKRVIKYYLEEYNIDWFRRDLSKWFTQSCDNINSDCIDKYLKDRVDIIKEYADYQWSISPDSYMILEHHWYNDSKKEEKEFSNYKNWILIWQKATEYIDLLMIWNKKDNNLSMLTRKEFWNLNAIWFSESHDEQRVMYRWLIYWKANKNYDVKTKENLLNRMKAIWAVTLLIPWPKMIRQFQELGYDLSINLCKNWNLMDDMSWLCRIDLKPSAFELWYDKDVLRKKVYEIWSKVIWLKLNNKIFESNNFYIDQKNNSWLTPIIYISNEKITWLNEVIIIANFDIENKKINIDIPENWKWYNLIENNKYYNITSKNKSIILKPWEFKILWNIKLN